MPQVKTLILSSGGMRSLVATAMCVEAGDAKRTALLHFKDGRACGAIRLEHTHRQASHFEVRQIIEIELTHLHGKNRTAASDATSPSLIRPQIVLTGLSCAINLGVERLVWPCQVNGDYEPTTRITEQVILTQQLGQLEHAKLPDLQTPLLELTDQQLVELGAQLDVPWELAWSCLMAGQQPCKICDACKRRKAAFDAAGISDPMAMAAPNR